MTLLEQILVPVPPPSEQQEIARQLVAVDAKLAALESRRAALAALFTSLLHHLLTARLRLPEFGASRTPP
jgi:type I restriction enzyme, S subunit